MPKGMNEQIESSEQGKVSGLYRDSLTKTNKQTNWCRKAVAAPMMLQRKRRSGGMTTSRLK